MSEFINSYQKHLTSLYPAATRRFDFKNSIANLVSSEVVPLNKNVFERAQKAIENIYAYSRKTEYKDHLLQKLNPVERECLSATNTNSSVLMGYDFHYDANTDLLSLIEINTNASAFLFVHALYDLFGDSNLYAKTALGKLKKSFTDEIQNLPPNTKPRFALIDENVTQQKMYPEFCMYDELFQKWGYSSQVAEFNTPDLQNLHFIYNRYTDFTLSQPQSKNLRELFLSNKVIFSPNPKEYLLLADKSRFIDFHAANISEVLIPTELVTPQAADRLRANRKKLFFKPQNMYGAKATYRGASISKKYFEEILNKNFVAQEYRPPGEFGGWKFDLRFYVYQNEIQLICARLYQGQVTNFGTIGGGLARVEFT